MKDRPPLATRLAVAIGNAAVQAGASNRGVARAPALQPSRRDEAGVRCSRRGMHAFGHHGGAAGCARIGQRRPWPRRAPGWRRGELRGRLDARDADRAVDLRRADRARGACTCAMTASAGNVWRARVPATRAAAERSTTAIACGARTGRTTRRGSPASTPAGSPTSTAPATG